jgi:maltose alpha-D-glucosyltransferase/alpha-amylase
VALHNLAAEATEVTLRLDGIDHDHRLIDLLSDGTTAAERDGTVRLALDGYGCRWLRAVRPGASFVP